MTQPSASVPLPPAPQPPGRFRAQQLATAGTVVSISLTPSSRAVRTLLGRLEESPEQAADLSFLAVDKARQAIADSRDTLAASPLHQPAGVEAATASLLAVCVALNQPFPREEVLPRWLAIIGELPPDLLDLATYRLERSFQYRGRHAVPGDWHDIVRDALNIRMSPFREADRLEQKLNFRAERIGWSLDRSQRELDDIDKLLAPMRARPEREDGLPLPAVLKAKEIPDWMREMWLLARRFISEHETRAVRDMLVYSELRRTGVPLEERMRQFPNRPRLNGALRKTPR